MKELYTDNNKTLMREIKKTVKQKDINVHGLDDLMLKWLKIFIGLPMAVLLREEQRWQSRSPV